MKIEMVGGGVLRVWEDGGRVFFQCECELHRDGIYKVWIRGDGGELLLGTLTPESEKLMLYRSIPNWELCRCGCWPVRDARCVMTYSFRPQRQGDGWEAVDDPGSFVNEETRKLGEWRRMLCRKLDNSIELACPVRKDMPLPLTHLFCFAVPKRIRGEMCLVWRFNGKGIPDLPTKTDN